VSTGRLSQHPTCVPLQENKLDQWERLNHTLIVRTFATGKGLGQWLLLAAFATILYFCFRIMQPFLMPIFLALILSTLLSPVYTVVSKKLNNRRSLSAFIVCIGLTVAILVPVVFLSMSLVSEVNDVYQRLKDPETLRKIDAWLDPTNSPIVRRIQTWLPGSFHVESLQLGAQAQRIGIALLGVATTFAAGIVNFIVDYFIMVAALFFLLRDSDYFAERARAISPLSDEQESMFVERFRTVARATVLGNLATTLPQGTVSAFTFFFLGLPNPLLWGLLIALLSSTGFRRWRPPIADPRMMLTCPAAGLVADLRTGKQVFGYRQQASNRISLQRSGDLRVLVPSLPPHRYP